MKQLFLSHFNRHAEEVGELAMELRFRGVRPWVDKQGGFLIADDSASAAERAIGTECLGFLLYATEDVFDREFIREHEVPHAVRMKESDEHFLLLAVPRSIGFEQLKERSQAAYGVDLSRYHTRQVKGDGLLLGRALAAVAADIAVKVIQLCEVDAAGDLNIQFSTRELGPVEDDALTFDGIEAYDHSGSIHAFDRLINGLRDSKHAIAARFGRPPIRVHGFKHLSAAFAFGRVFQPFDITVRQTPDDYWSLAAAPSPEPTLTVTSTHVPASSDLVVQISSRFKALSDAVDSTMVGVPFNRLILSPITPPLDVDQVTCATMARDCYCAIENEIAHHPVRRIHLFAAAPQAFMMSLGRKFAGMPTTLVYDYNGSAYNAPKSIPGGVL